MKPIKLLGAITQAADNVIQLAGGRGLPDQVELAADAAQTVLAVAAADQSAADRVTAVVRHLEGRGSAREALQAHFPSLPAQGLALALAVADWATEAVGKDGKIDAADLPGLLPRLMAEMQQ